MGLDAEHGRLVSHRLREFGQPMAHVIVVGGGPAGLMAADVVSAAGVGVTLYERMPSLGRKLLMAGRGGLNLTHSEALPALLARYGEAESWLRSSIEAFPPDALCGYARALGQETFVGTSGRVFPCAMKASPLLRSWIAKLTAQSVVFRTRHRMIGLDDLGRPLIEGPAGEVEALQADATVLAMGGASWPRLGSDGGWVEAITTLGIHVEPLAPANAGVVVAWSSHFRDRHVGAPLKRIALTAGDVRVAGELVVTETGLEGAPVYALNPVIRTELGRQGRAHLAIDLKPDLDELTLIGRLQRPRGKQSVSTWLRKSVGLSPVAIGVMREALSREWPESPLGYVRSIKALPILVTGLGGLDRAISTAGGVALDEVGADMMLRRRPGVFVAGEMLDWEAPTGGYLLQACFATGHAAGRGVLSYLASRAGPMAQLVGPPAAPFFQN